MEFLRSFSIIWSMIFVMIISLMMYDLRFNRKKNVVISTIVMTPLIILTCVLSWNAGVEKIPQLIFGILTIPSLILFSFMTKKRDGKFFFIFCFVATISFAVFVFTNLLDTWLGGGKVIIMFIARLILFPLFAFVVWKYICKPYMKLQQDINSGWGLFAVISSLYFVLILVMVSFPTFINDRPEDIPGLLVLFAIMPVTYIAMFKMLIRQRNAYKNEEHRINAEKQNEILQNELQVEKEYVEQARYNRHDVRHILQVVLDYLKQGEYEKAEMYLADYETAVEETVLPTYCENHIINALLRINARRCTEENIAFQVQAVIPAKLPYSDIESGVLFGNLFENAYEAARKCLNPFVYITANIRDEKLLLIVCNSVSNDVQFHEGVPVTTKDGGGVGVRSAMQILEKHGGIMRMEQSGNMFTTQVIQTL